jgi:OHCU decarboxylase
MVSLAEINRLSPEAFVALLGGIFEHSPWIADAAGKCRPFNDLGALHAAMTRIVAESPAEKQLALIQAHPDLAGRLARQGLLTAESSREQAGAGLADADAGTLARIGALNSAYRAKFGFPFIICARLNDVGSILRSMESRLAHDVEEEFSTALAEIGKITQLRLKDLVEE